MNKTFITLCVSALLLSCDKKPANGSETVTYQDSVTVIPETNDPVEPSTVQNCYIGTDGKDSVFVSLEDNLGTIIGKMRFKNSENNSSSGTVVGSKNGDTLKLIYTYEAEGSTSDREIFFLKQDGKLAEAIGEYKTEGNKTVYLKTSGLQYTGNIYNAADCAEVE